MKSVIDLEYRYKFDSEKINSFFSFLKARKIMTSQHLDKKDIV
jgi:hypothetical protein